MKDDAKRDQGGRPDGDGPGHGVGEEDVRDTPSTSTVTLSEGGQRTDAPVGHKHGGLDCDQPASDQHRSVPSADEPGQDQPDDGRQLDQERP